MVDDVLQFLEGKTGDLRGRVREAMIAASDGENYERARGAAGRAPVAGEAGRAGGGRGHRHRRCGRDRLRPRRGRRGGGADPGKGRPGGRPGASVPRGRRGGDRPGDPERVPGALLRPGGSARAPDRAAVSARRLGRAARAAAGLRLDRSAAGHRAALAGAGGPQRAPPAGEPPHRVVRDRGAGRGSGVRAGPRPGAQLGAAEPRLHRHLAQPGQGHRRLAGLVRGRAPAKERVPEVQDRRSRPAGRLRRDPGGRDPLSHPPARRAARRFPT